MKCAICGITTDSVDEAIDQGWIPYVWDGDREIDGPFCGSCFEGLIEIDGDGEFVVKEAFTGKIKYQGGDFYEEEVKEPLVSGLILEFCQN
jgi:hypothetical protein